MLGKWFAQNAEFNGLPGRQKGLMLEYVSHFYVYRYRLYIILNFDFRHCHFSCKKLLLKWKLVCIKRTCLHKQCMFLLLLKRCCFLSN